MVNRKLTERERQIYDMIPDDGDNLETFSDIVYNIRREIDDNRFSMKKGWKRLNDCDHSNDNNNVTASAS